MNELRYTLSRDPRLLDLSRKLTYKGISNIILDDPPSLRVTHNDLILDIPVRVGYLDILATPVPYDSALSYILSVINDESNT